VGGWQGSVVLLGSPPPPSPSTAALAGSWDSRSVGWRAGSSARMRSQTCLCVACAREPAAGWGVNPAFDPSVRRGCAGPRPCTPLPSFPQPPSPKDEGSPCRAAHLPGVEGPVSPLQGTAVGLGMATGAPPKEGSLPRHHVPVTPERDRGRERWGRASTPCVGGLVRRRNPFIAGLRTMTRCQPPPGIAAAPIPGG